MGDHYKKGLFHGVVFGFIIGILLFILSALDQDKYINKIYNSAVDNKVGEFKIINPNTGETKFFWITNK